MKRGFLLIALIAPSGVIAEEVVQNCGGRWTNLPCDAAKVQGTMAVRPSAPVLSPEEARARSRKESALHKLTMKSIEAKRNFGVEVELSYTRDLCEDRKSTFEQCRDEIERIEEKLDRKIQGAEAALRKREEEEKESREKAEREARAPETTIVIQEQWPIYRRGYPGYPLPRPTRVAPVQPRNPGRTASGARIVPPPVATASPWLGTAR